MRMHPPGRMGFRWLGALVLPWMLAVPCSGLEWIELDAAGTGFVSKPSGKPFKVWGVNYDHTEDGRLLEEYWHEEWGRVTDDFREIRELGANVVRIHLQLGRFMKSAVEPDARNLSKLVDLLNLAEDNGLYLNLTGLGCYRLKDVPKWYDALEEKDRWEVQARFWKSVAQVCASSSSVFCFDLMNEPILAAPKEGEPPWLTGELGGYYFVQRLSRDLAGRDRKAVAAAWTEKMRSAIKEVDRRHLITVGVIPWAHVFPKAKPLFYSPEVGRHLDFASVHFYPKSGEVDAALAALKVYDVGKPLVIEETFPLKCSVDELVDFLERSRPVVDGWTSFYWGTTAAEYSEKKNDLASAIKGNWLNRFQALARTYVSGENGVPAKVPESP